MWSGGIDSIWTSEPSTVAALPPSCVGLPLHQDTYPSVAPHLLAEGKDLATAGRQGSSPPIDLASLHLSPQQSFLLDMQLHGGFRGFPENPPPSPQTPDLPDLSRAASLGHGISPIRSGSPADAYHSDFLRSSSGRFPSLPRLDLPEPSMQMSQGMGFDHLAGIPRYAGHLPQGALGVLGGLSAEQLRAALQQPRTADYLRNQLEAENALAAKLQQQQVQALDERFAAARLMAHRMKASRPPPPPPSRSLRPSLPPPLDTAAVQRYLATSSRSGSVRSGAGSTTSRPGRDRSQFLGGKPKADMAALNESLEALAQSLRPDAEEISCLDRAFRRVSSLLMERYPQAKVHLVGSAANDCILGIRNSNCIDVCLDIPDRDHDATFKAVLVGEMGQLAVGAGMASVLPLPSARTPVLKFTIPETGTRVDVFVDARLALANTKLLADYAAIDSRLPKLVSIVKHWAKRRQVNDSYRGTLSSYCYTLMCIHHLQTREAPVLPCLQAINPPRVAGGGSGGPFTVAAPKFESTNTESLADLIWSFFEHFAWGHDYNNSVVSVRSGGLLAKTQKEWTRRLGNERHLICVEDPYDVSHDLGCTVDRQTSGILHREFERAASALKDLEDPLPQLFEPYRAGRAE